jgi:hypothetical protein
MALRKMSRDALDLHYVSKIIFQFMYLNNSVDLAKRNVPVHNHLKNWWLMLTTGMNFISSRVGHVNYMFYTKLSSGL